MLLLNYYINHDVNITMDILINDINIIMAILNKDINVVMVMLIIMLIL